MKVYKVLYAPVSMPFFTYRLAGLIAFIALTVKSNWEVPLNQGIAAYYNGLGDLHLENNETLLAESYFEEAANYGYNNHKSNFTLATFHADRKEYEKAAVRYKDALAKWPSPQAYVNLGNLYLDDGRFFDALFIAKEGVKRFQNSFQIQNNLGLLYGKTGILDSSIYYLDNAYSKSKNETTSSNILAVVARSDFSMDADSVLSEYDIADDPISVNNNYVLYNNSLKALELPYLSEDTVLGFLDASILFNRSFNHLYSEDSLNTRVIFELANKPYNAGTREQLEYIACLNLYKNKNVNKAFRELNWLANGSISNSGKFFNLIGTWALDQEASDVAAQYFEWAENKDWSEASFNKAIALSENGRIAEAVESWEQIEKSRDKEAQEIARTMSTILTMDLSNFNQLADYQKYLVIRYRLLSSDITICKNLASTISDMNYRAQAYLDMCKKLWKDDAVDLAVSLYQELGGLEITDRRLYEETQWFELRMLAFSKKVRLLAEKINQGIAFDNEHILEKHFYTGLLMEASGDTTAARKNYQLIAYMNPFFEEAVIHSAEFISLRDGFEAYNILLSSLEVNPNSIKLLKAFIMQCAKVELNTYAENSLDDLSGLISTTEFLKFRQEYEELVKQVVEEAENF
ncbi:MAG: tetratricopeptide repeat protein [Bacteroidota bacterium]